MGSRRKARILAFQALYGWDMTRCPVDELLQFGWMKGVEQELPAWARAEKGEDTLAFSRILVAGTIEHIEDVDGAIKAHLKNWDFGRLTRVDLAVLRMSAYALLFVPSIPASVTIDEAIDIAKEFGADESYKFVNGVLDGIRKEGSGK